MTNLKLPEAVERDVRLLLSEGEKIKAILLIRQTLGVGLREGKELVESLAALSRAEIAVDQIKEAIRADERARIAKTISRLVEDEWLPMAKAIGLERLAEEIERGES